MQGWKCLEDTVVFISLAIFDNYKLEHTIRNLFEAVPDIRVEV
jgi:hypothetical protein